jgi:hypothetical protein
VGGNPLTSPAPVHATGCLSAQTSLSRFPSTLGRYSPHIHAYARIIPTFTIPTMSALATAANEDVYFYLVDDLLSHSDGIDQEASSTPRLPSSASYSRRSALLALPNDVLHLVRTFPAPVRPAAP